MAVIGSLYGAMRKLCTIFKLVSALIVNIVQCPTWLEQMFREDQIVTWWLSLVAGHV